MSGLQLKYFVLRPGKDDAHGRASRIAMNAYAKAIENENPKLANDLRDWITEEAVKIAESNYEKF